MNVIKKSFDLGDGRIVEIETGKLAKQADGAVVVKMGDTMLLATVVSTVGAKPGTDFLPLSVDYQEKYAATGRIPGGFLRREARLSDYEVLISRLVDRALRPMFPEDYHADVQVMISLISADKNIMPDCLAGLAASAARAPTRRSWNFGVTTRPSTSTAVSPIGGTVTVSRPSRSVVAEPSLKTRVRKVWPASCGRIVALSAISVVTGSVDWLVNAR